MPWGKRRDGNKVCVYKKTTGKVLHCYSGSDADSRADKYLAALHAYAHKETDLDEISNGLYMAKEDDGYIITTVSTAAMKDSDGETFSTDAIDWDIKEAERTGEYPEYRMFHKKSLAIGKVEKMSRVGIFAVDQGRSYTDPFSLEVCKEILSKNNGKWRCSRGFFVHEASGSCPKCGNGLVINKEHMIAGFRCPSCKTVHMSYKGVLKDVHFRKARTFDVTITDIPAMSYTGVSAKRSNTLEAKEMLTKAQLKQKLLDAGISEDVIEQKMSGITSAQLKEFGNDIPEAVLLKELDIVEDEDDVDDDDTENKEEDEDDGEQTFVLDPSVLKEFALIVDKMVGDKLDGLMIDVETPVEKEFDAIAELKEMVESLTEQVGHVMEILSKTDEERIKELVKDAPRNAKLRVMRYKASKASKPDPEDDMDEDEPDDDEDDVEEKELIVGSDGFTAVNMTEFITAK